jgi:peptidoglycan/xylan/chitin deacetylase (PgdA/CDA1 family)
MDDNPDEPLKLVFTFDDGHHSIYDRAFPIMQDYGFRGTNFVNSGLIGGQGMMSWDQIREMEHIYNWETGAHTLNHEDLTQMNLGDAIANIEADKQNLRDQGLNPVSFALPKGQAPYDLYPTLMNLFDYLRGSSDFAMHRPINRYALGYLPYQSKWSADLIKARILRGISNSEDLIIIGFHRFDDDEDIFPDSCSSSVFREILDFVDSLKLDVIPLNEAF